jgi:hypothetical protein
MTAPTRPSRKKAILAALAIGLVVNGWIFSSVVFISTFVGLARWEAVPMGLIGVVTHGAGWMGALITATLQRLVMRSPDRFAARDTAVLVTFIGGVAASVEMVLMTHFFR